MHFADALTERIRATSPVCVGLDPQLSKLPDGIPRDAEGVLTFNRGIIEAVKDIAAIVKPQLAFYEVLGWQGMKVFWETCHYAKEHGLMVLADGKRGDIGSTSEAYAQAYLHADSPVDALTIHLYHGSETMTPFFECCDANGKGVYVLVKTSNPSSGDLQDLPVGDEVLHEHVSQMVQGWGNGHLGPKTNLSCIGAVVGAPYPEEMKYLRSLMPNVPFLIPGYGAQGGTAQDAKHGFLADGTGAIVSASRSILYASGGKDWAEAAGNAARKMAEELKAVLA